MRKLLVIILAALLVIGAILAPITAALAHSSLVSSTPPDGAELKDAPRRIALEFNEPVRENFGQVEVTGPDGDTYASGEPTVNSATVTQPLSDLGPQGRYQVGWRVVSADGHPVSGSFVFWLGERGGGGGSGSSGGSNEAAGRSVSPALLTGGAAVIVVLVLAGALLVSRKRRQGQVE